MRDKVVYIACSCSVSWQWETLWKDVGGDDRTRNSADGHHASLRPCEFIQELDAKAIITLTALSPKLDSDACPTPSCQKFPYMVISQPCFNCPPVSSCSPINTVHTIDISAVSYFWCDSAYFQKKKRKDLAVI